MTQESIPPEVVEKVARALCEASATYEPGIGMNEPHVGWPQMAEVALSSCGWAEMREALEPDILEALAESINDYFPDGVRMLRILVKKARAALARAEGKDNG